MYRQYENPYSLEDRLAELEAIKKRLVNENKFDERFESLQEDIEGLKDRINHAWQDDEC